MTKILTKKIFTINVLICMMLIASIAWSKIIHVPGDYPKIQAGIDAAVQDDVILVAAGTYHENIVVNGKQIVVESEQGAEATTIDGNQKGSVVSIIAGAIVTIDGFTLRNGFATHGGGIYAEDSFLTIENCAITENTATSTCDVCGGGGIFLRFCTSEIHNNLISNNSSYGDGGGIIFWAGTSTMTYNTISNNQAEHWVGGVYVRNCNATVECNMIMDNTAGNVGGIRNCDGSGSLRSNLIVGNSASGVGGGIGMRNTSMTIVNNTIVGNSSNQGGGIYIDHWGPVPGLIRNNIVASNLSGGGIYAGSNLSYNDVWNNLGGNYVGCEPGPGDISADPLFVNVGDYHLQSASPCIDAGTSDGAPPYDIKGNPRDEFPDMGAYEYQVAITGSINGTVTDRTGNSIKWALVIAVLGETRIKAFTDSEGYYEIPDLESGTYWVLCIKRDYKPGIRKAEVIAGEETTLDFVLEPKQN